PGSAIEPLEVEVCLVHPALTPPAIRGERARAALESLVEALDIGPAGSPAVVAAGVGEEANPISLPRVTRTGEVGSQRRVLVHEPPPVCPKGVARGDLRDRVVPEWLPVDEVERERIAARGRLGLEVEEERPAG